MQAPALPEDACAAAWEGLCSKPQRVRSLWAMPTGHARRGGPAGGRQPGQADRLRHLRALRLRLHRRSHLLLHPGGPPSRSTPASSDAPAKGFFPESRAAWQPARRGGYAVTVRLPAQPLTGSQRCACAGDRAAGNAYHVRGAAVQHVAGAGGAERQPGAQAVQDAARGQRPLRRASGPAGVP